MSEVDNNHRTAFISSVASSKEPHALHHLHVCKQQSFANKRAIVTYRRTVRRSPDESMYNDAASVSRKKPINWGSGKAEL